jgi:mercuric ion transport protein
MPRVELLYFPGCPNLAAARAQLERALAAADLAAQWREYDLGAPQLPDHLRGFGSPTILVDGRDVAGTTASGAPACRVYAEGAGAPPLPALVAALRASVTNPPNETVIPARLHRAPLAETPR